MRNLRPYFQIAVDESNKSPCSRRRYGCVITWESTSFDNFVVGANYRMTDCCNGVACARTRFDTVHGARVEIGAEIHAETAALIRWGSLPEDDSNPVVILVGFAGEKELRGSDVYPCHVCAVNLKFAGFKYIYIKDDDDTIIPVSISAIIERRELEWEPV